MYQSTTRRLLLLSINFLYLKRVIEISRLLYNLFTIIISLSYPFKSSHYYACNSILPHPPTFYYLHKSKKKSRSGISTPNRHLFLLLFIFTFNLCSIQKHYQQCSISVKDFAPSVYSMNFSAR